MLLALCGRKGSGKTTVANLLTSGRALAVPPLVNVTDPWAYMANVLLPSHTYLFKQFSMAERQAKLKRLQRHYLDTRNPIFCNMRVPHLSSVTSTHVPQVTNMTYPRPWQHVSFAEPLKAVAPLLTGLSYRVLCGDTPQTRHDRETLQTMPFDRSGSVTGRQALQHIGTDMLCSGLCPKLFAVLAAHRATDLLNKGYHVVVSDVRFKHEWDTLSAYVNKYTTTDAHLCIVARQPQDLMLTKTDQLHNHCSEWQHLTFANKKCVLWNNGSKHALHTLLMSLVNSLQ